MSNIIIWSSTDVSCPLMVSSRCPKDVSRYPAMMFLVTHRHLFLPQDMIIWWFYGTNNDLGYHYSHPNHSHPNHYSHYLEYVMIIWDLHKFIFDDILETSRNKISVVRYYSKSSDQFSCHSKLFVCKRCLLEGDYIYKFFSWSHHIV